MLMDYTVVLDTVTEQKVAASRRRTTFSKISQEIGELLGFSWTFVKERPGLRTDGCNVAIYRNETGDGEVEVGVQVVRAFEDTEGDFDCLRADVDGYAGGGKERISRRSCRLEKGPEQYNYRQLV